MRSSGNRAGPTRTEENTRDTLALVRWTTSSAAPRCYLQSQGVDTEGFGNGFATGRLWNAIATKHAGESSLSIITPNGLLPAEAPT